MPQIYKLVKRKNLGKDQAELPEKVYAQGVSSGMVTFDELCTEISEGCTLTSADIKAAFDRTNYVLDKHLRTGRIVQLGEIGNFRLGVGSGGAASEEEFAPSLLRRPKIVFTPGGKLRDTRHKVSFERLTLEPVTTN